jgi:DNA-binding IclR family transcriptional regulator
MDALRKGLWVISQVSRAGQMTAARLALAPGWDRVQAHRYLTLLTEEGWLDCITSRGKKKYVLGPKVLALNPDLRL